MPAVVWKRVHACSGRIKFPPLGAWTLKDGLFLLRLSCPHGLFQPRLECFSCGFNFSAYRREFRGFKREFSLLLMKILDKTGCFVHIHSIMADNLARQFEYFADHGFTEKQAQALVMYHQDRVEQLLATKRDIADVKKDIEQLRADTKKDIAGVYQAVEQLRADTKRDIEQLRADTGKEFANVRKDIEQLRADTGKGFADVRKDIEQLRAETKKDIENVQLKIVVRLGAIIVASVGAAATIMSIFG